MLGWNKLFGQDQKVEFSSQFAFWLRQDSLAVDDPRWQALWTTFDGPADVLSLLPSAALASAPPANLLVVLKATTAQLERLLRGRLELAPPEWARHVLNTVRVIGRVVPFVYSADRGKGAEDEFWAIEEVAVAAPEHQRKQEEPEDQFVLEDSDDEDATPTPRPPPGSEERKQGRPTTRMVPPLALRIMRAVIDGMFVVGFTVPAASGNDGVVADEAGVPMLAYTIWESGIASPPGTPSPPSAISPRIELLRLLSLLLSLPSFLTPPHVFPYPSSGQSSNLWRDALVDHGLSSAVFVGDAPLVDGRDTTLERRTILCLLCSLLNTFLRPAGTEGGAAGAATGGAGAAKAVAGSTLSTLSGVVRGGTGEELRPLLRTTAGQVLSILLIDHAFPPPPLPNLFTKNLAKLHRPSDFAHLVKGASSLVSTELASAQRRRAAANTAAGKSLEVLGSLVSPGGGADGKGKGGTEAIVVVWRAIQTNRKFGAWAISDADDGGKKDIAGLVVLCVLLCLECKDDLTQMGAIRLATFFLQSLTSHEGVPTAFSTVRLSDATPSAAPQQGYRLAAVSSLLLPQAADLRTALAPFDDGSTIVDFVVVAIHALIFSTKSMLSPLYPSFLLVQSNLSPSFNSLSAQASGKLVGLFMAFSNADFVLMEDGNPRLVYWLLESICQVICYRDRLNNNPNLARALLKAQERLESLQVITLARGTAEARWIKRERKQARASSATHQASRARGTSISSFSVLSLPTSPSSEFNRRLSSSSLNNTSEVDVRSRALERVPSLSGVQEAAEEEAEPAGASDPLQAEGEEKGKGRQRSTSEATDPLQAVEDRLGRASLDTFTAAGERDGHPNEEDEPFVGKNGFRPTEEWVTSWREGLPIAPVLQMLAALPAGANVDFTAAFFPPSLFATPPPFARRDYTPSPQFTTWLASIVYGSVYLSCHELLREVPVRLFAVEERPGAARSRGIPSMASLEGIAGAARDFVVGGGRKP